MRCAMDCFCGSQGGGRPLRIASRARRVLPDAHPVEGRRTASPAIHARAPIPAAARVRCVVLYASRKPSSGPTVPSLLAVAKSGVSHIQPFRVSHWYPRVWGVGGLRACVGGFPALSSSVEWGVTTPWAAPIMVPHWLPVAAEYCNVDEPVVVGKKMLGHACRGLRLLGRVEVGHLLFEGAAWLCKGRFSLVLCILRKRSLFCIFCIFSSNFFFESILPSVCF